MKKFTAALCTVLLLIGAVLVPGAAAAGPALANTRAYCIMDADTGLVLAQQNMDEELHPASITKVMTLGLACEKAQGDWDDVKLTVTHEDVYSLAGTDSSHIALLEGEEVPLVDALYATQMASANDGANLLAEYFGGGTIADGVAAMNAQVEELGLAHTHFSNPHGISDDDHYTSCYDMAQILRWALQQPGFEDLFTRNEMYTMQPTNIQPVTRYFSQQDKIRIGSSRYHIDSVLGSKLGYTNTARYSYVCLAEQDGVRLICATMQSQLSTDKYNDMRTLLDYAFSTYKSYTQLPGGTVTAQLAVAGGGQSLGTVTVADPGVKLLLAEGLSAQDVTVDLELPEQYLLGAEPAVYAVYTLNGGAQQESTSVRVKAEITGLSELLEQSVGTKLEAARDVEPGSSAWLLAGISVGCTIGAAVVTVLVLRVHSRLKKRRKTARHHKKRKSLFKTRLFQIKKKLSEKKRGTISWVSLFLRRPRSPAWWSLSRRCSAMTAAILWRPTRRTSSQRPVSTRNLCRTTRAAPPGACCAGCTSRRTTPRASWCA